MPAPTPSSPVRSYGSIYIERASAPRDYLPEPCFRVISLSLSSNTDLVAIGTPLKVEFFIPIWPGRSNSVILRPDFPVNASPKKPETLYLDSMNLSKEISPVTGEPFTEFITEISAANIIDQYNEIRIDVRGFFQGIDSVEIRRCKRTGY